MTTIMRTHPFYTMSLCIGNAMQMCHCMPIPFHIYDECYMDILNHASFGQSYQLTYNFQINHTTHVNIFYTHVLTSTSHHQSSNDLHYTLGFIVTPCPQIANNQAMQWPCSYTNTCISLSLMDNYINMHIITKQHTPISRY